ncbi:DNA polymerase [Thermodesulfobacteriota bacterium]
MSPEYLLSVIQSQSRVAVTAPLIMNEHVLIGFAISAEESYCVDLSLTEFTDLCPTLYHGRMPTVAYHGLKRIWKFLDDRGLRPAGETTNRSNISKIDDTRLMAYLLDPDSSDEVKYQDYRVQEKITLAHTARRYLHKDYPYRMPDIAQSCSRELAAEILAHDAGLIYDLAERLPSVMSADLLKLYRNVELPLMVVLDDMRRIGIGFDGLRCAELMVETQHSMALLAQEITGGESVDLTSPEEVHRFLLAQGVPLQVAPAYVRRRGLKKPLDQIADAYPLVRKLLAWWDMGRDLGFLRRWAGQNRIHPVWGQTRSATSRVYARSPAVQNISRALRKLFVPAPGHVLVKADYSQAQLRILAHLSGDPDLVRVYNDPQGDVHTETSEWLGLHDRTVAKEINFAICFGMGAAGLCKKINDLKERQGSTDLIDLTVAQSYIDGFYAKYPRVKAFFDEQWERVKQLPSQDRVVRSLIGRERRFPRRPTAEMERQFRVTWTQQIEADLMKTAMVRLDRILRRRGMKARIVMMIHDALWVECPNDEENEVRRLVRRMMTTAGRLDVPLDIDFE